MRVKADLDVLTCASPDLVVFQILEVLMSQLKSFEYCSCLKRSSPHGLAERATNQKVSLYRKAVARRCRQIWHVKRDHVSYGSEDVCLVYSDVRYAQ